MLRTKGEVSGSRDGKDSRLEGPVGFGPDWNILATVKWIAVKFDTDIWGHLVITVFVLFFLTRKISRL